MTTTTANSTATAAAVTAAHGNTQQTPRQSFATARANAPFRKPSQYERLHEAERQGKDALTAFIESEQKKRDAKALEEWRGYALWRPADRRYWSHVLTPDGLYYRCEDGENGTKRFVGCPDLVFVDAVNAAAKRLKIPARLDGKHALIAHLLERAVWRGERVWVPCAAVGAWEAGFVTMEAGR